MEICITQGELRANDLALVKDIAQATRRIESLEKRTEDEIRVVVESGEKAWDGASSTEG
jgi:hypothetical protein